jgi:hypothetical protein
MGMARWNEFCLIVIRIGPKSKKKEKVKNHPTGVKGLSCWVYWGNYRAEKPFLGKYRCRAF